MPVAQSSELIQVRNMKPGPTVFTVENTVIEWAGSGDPSGGDVQHVSSDLRRDPNFARMLQIGVLTEATPAEGAAALTAQSNQIAAAKAASDSLTGALVEPTTSNDMLSIGCVGPGPRAGTRCDQPQIVVARQLADHPPLCDAHKPLAASFTNTGTAASPVWQQAS